MKRKISCIILAVLLCFTTYGFAYADLGQTSGISTVIGVTLNENADSVQASDYSDEKNWMVRPEKDKFDVDVIYFYPTAYYPEKGDPTVCTIENAAMRKTALQIYQQQGTAFETVGNMYAPYYRQIEAASLAGKTQKEMIADESGVPKADVFASMDYYFKHYNKGKPYIIAGHSQGAMMVYLLLDEYMEQHPNYYKRMVAAYMIGNAATTDWLADNPHVKMATRASDTGVLVTWNTEGESNIGQYNMVVPENSVCINPLNWKTDETYAGVNRNKGSYIDGKIVEGIADAQINLKRGSVICRSVDPKIYAMPESWKAMFGTESYHGNDYSFYYMNIRKNAELRAKVFLKKRK